MLLLVTKITQSKISVISLSISNCLQFLFTSFRSQHIKIFNLPQHNRPIILANSDQNCTVSTDNTQMYIIQMLQVYTIILN